MEYTFFQTEQYNNKFLLIENGVNRIIEIEIGNYNLVTFLTELTVKLNDATSLYNYVISYIPNANRLKYIATPKPLVPLISIVFQFNRNIIFNTTGVDIIESLNEMMGFLDDAAIALSLTATANGFTCESTTPISMSPGVQNLYMVINNSCQNYAYTSVDNTFSSSNILDKIPIATPPFSTLFFFDINSNFSTIITNRYLDNLSFTLFNEQFTEITPRKNYSFTIRIDIVVPSTNIDTKKTLEQILDLKKMSFINKKYNILYCIIMRTNFKKVGRRARNTFKRVGTIIRKGASVIRSILGTIDNASGGALTAKLQ
jgi:hypothetical protein